MNKKVSCIIAAYNESDRIKNVLDVISGHPNIDEIIVVDDGSMDRTKEIVSTYADVKLIVLPENKGKMNAVCTGIEYSSGDFVFLLDADLIGIKQHHITDLLTPVITNIADVSIALREDTQWYVKLIGIDYISGQRVFSRKIIENDIENIRLLPGYALEVAINRLIIKNSLRIKVVYWRGVSATLKQAKLGLLKGELEDIRMIKEIMKTITVLGPFYQQIKMRMQRI